MPNGERPPVKPPVPPVEPPDVFTRKLLEWEAKAVLYEERVKPLEVRSTTLQAQMSVLQEAAAAKLEKAHPIQTLFPSFWFAEKMAPTIKLGLEEELRPLRDEYRSIQLSLLKDIFYIDLYRTVPALVATGSVSSVDEALAMLALPEDLSAAEAAEAREVVSSMLEARAAGVPIEAEPGELVYPPLVAPAPITTVPVSIHTLSTQEIIKSLKTPIAPEAAMTDAEWKDYLASLGWSPEDIDNETLIRADQLIEDVLSRKSQIEEWRTQVAAMPEYKMTDFLKELIIQPPLAVLEALNYYYEHVSMPAAAIVWGWGFTNREITTLYRDFRQSNPEATTREALVYAWHKWEAPGPPVFDFVLKYVVMEGLVDPLTYVGWGLATWATKSLGPIGRGVASFERAAAEILELPFDFIKWTARTIIPKTVSQRAAVLSRNLGRTVDQYITKTLGRPLNYIQMDEFADTAGLALRHFIDNPRADDDIARVGLALATHSPVDDIVAKNWIRRLRATGLTTFSPEDLTAQTLKDIDDIFERVFFKELTAEAAAPTLLLKLGVTAPTDDATKLAARFLGQRYDRIINKALAFTRERTPYRAMRTFMDATQDIMIKSEKSKAAIAARQSGRYSVLFQDVPQRLHATWRNTIDRWLIRPFARAYLTFGMYGPQNIVEDIWRSALGGVNPVGKAGLKRGTIAQLDMETIGLRIDPELRIYGLSEMLGVLKQTKFDATRSNWVLTIGMMPLSLPTWAATKGKLTPRQFARRAYQVLVEAPGSIGMDIRRNFVIKRNRQILGELGGDAYLALSKAGPKEVPDIITQKWLRNSLKDNVYRAKVTGQLTPDNTTFVDALKANFGREQINSAEVAKIIQQYPDLSVSTRNLVAQLYDDGTLLRSADDIDRTMRNIVWGNELDDFLKGPELATRQYQQLTDLLKGLEIRNPEDMAHLVQSLHQMSKTYSATPRQIMGRATVKSRGLPLTERRATFDIDFDRIHTFMDKAGVNIDETIASIRTKMVTMPDNYQAAADDVLDIMTTMRESAAEFRTTNMASRHEIFAAASPADMKSTTFWDNFYLQMDNEVNIFNRKAAELNGRLSQSLQLLNEAAGAPVPRRPKVIVRDRPLAPNDVAMLMQNRNDEVSRLLLDVLTAEGDRDFFIEYVLGLARQGYDVGFTRESVGAVYDQIAHSLRVDPNSSSWLRSRELELDSMTRDLHDLFNSKLLPDDQAVAVGRYIDDTARAAADVIYEPPRAGVPTRAKKTEFADYDNIRQQAWDGAEKWYYKEYPDYTNANAFDAAMKTVYPFWTYESQRWFWLPRSFMRHPGTLTALGRYQRETEYGYFHIPGTAIDYRPVSGTIYGPWTSLMRRDYPEYYDQLEGAEGLVEFSDFLQRYGFYPNVVIGGIQALFGGREQQLGGVLPASYSTTLNALISAFPDNDLVTFISERIFPNRFRNYLIARRVDDFGGDGSLLFAKIKEGIELTPEEEDMWTTARQSAASHSAAFEQFGLFRMRDDKAYEVYEASAKFIEQEFGYTVEQQKWLRLHNFNLWDLVGGLDPWQTSAMQELEYFKYVGSIRPLLPSAQQEILNKIETGWADVKRYSETMQLEILDLQQDFLTGTERGKLGPREFLGRVRDLFRKRKEYVDEKTKANPLMLLENRTEYYEKYRQPIPVQSPYKELMSMYFNVELEDTIDEATGERIYNWDKFWATRAMIDAAVQDEDRADWDAYIARNTAPIMRVWYEVYERYFKKYYGLWKGTLETYPEEEQRIIEEFLYLERTDEDLTRQAAIKEVISTKTNKKLVSGFRSDVSGNRAALRYANPNLDAWLFYWGRVTSFKVPQSEAIFRQISKDTGRIVE